MSSEIYIPPAMKWEHKLPETYGPTMLDFLRARCHERHNSAEHWVSPFLFGYEFIVKANRNMWEWELVRPGDKITESYKYFVTVEAAQQDAQAWRDKKLFEYTDSNKD